MRLGLIAALVLLLAGGTAAAWVAPDREAPEEAAPGYQARPDRTLVRARGVPAGWSGLADRESGVVAELFGGYVAAPGAVADPAVAERAARAFIAANAGLIAPGTKAADLVLAANVVERGLRTVTFRQTWRGAPVVGGQLAIMIRNDRVFAATSQIVPDVTISVPARIAPVPTGRALAWIGGRLAVRSVGPRVVLPVAGKVVVADQIEVAALDRVGAWDVYVGLDGAPVLRASRLRFADSVLQFDVGVRQPHGARHAAPAPEANITADGTATTTGTDGSFSWAGTAAATVAPRAMGTRISVANAAGSAATAQLTAQPGTPVTWSLANDEYGDAQLTSFIDLGIAKTRARAIVPQIEPWLDEQLSVTVNELGFCNAYSTGDDVHFFVASDGFCENSGRFLDIVSHELGHSIHFHAIIPGAGAFNDPLSEGVADFFTSTIVEDHVLGVGFTPDGQPVRDLDPVGREAVWPRDKSSDPHATGLIIGGALWDLRTALIAQLGETAGRAQTDVLYASVLERSPDIPGAFMAVQIADDDDGDLGNGTPHACAIEAAFGRHGLAGPSFLTTKVDPPTFDGTTFTVRTETPTNTPCPPPQVTKVELLYHVIGRTTTALPFTRNGDTWTAPMPDLPDNKVVLYQIAATMDDGVVVSYPDNPADPEYQVFKGTPSTLWCEPMDADPRWTQGDTPSWEWGMPAPLSVAGDPITTHTGTGVYGSKLSGDGRYPRSATTSVSAPETQTWMYDEVHLQFWRWLTIEDGNFDQASISINGEQAWSNAKAPDGSLDHVDKEWRFQDIDVTQWADYSITPTWTIQSDSSRELGGWTLDDVCLVGLGKHPVCGDGVLDYGEDCDDGNLDSGDGCDDICHDDGGCCSAGGSPAGPLVLTGAVGLLVRRRRRRH